MLAPPPFEDHRHRSTQSKPAFTEPRTRGGFTDGSKPAGRLIQGSEGLIYGATVNGGDFGLGTVFSLDGAGTLTTLHHFAGDDGANPNAGVIQGVDGRLYGTTTNGGAFGQGTVRDGTLYGAAPNGGPEDGGVIFCIRLATFPSDQIFELVSRNTGKCLDISGGSTEPAAPAIQWFCHGGPNQQWRLEPVGGGAFHIIARHSGQALDVSGGLLDDVTPIMPLASAADAVWSAMGVPIVRTRM